MTNALDSRAESLFHEALAVAPGQREALLRDRCADDARLRKRVARLLRLHDEAEIVLDTQGAAAARAAVLDDDGERWIGAQIGPFRVLCKLGRGGMGLVVLAEQEHPRRKVALKLLDSPLVSSEAWQRFGYEIDVLASLDHPGIARVLEAGSALTPQGNVRYFAMEYVNGVPLRSLIGRADVELGAKLALLADVAEAVAHAHAHGIVHRDLKPENVLVLAGPAERAWSPKVLDFGIAKSLGDEGPARTLHTQTGLMLGTLEYMSPEQIDGDSERVDQRSDVYALGVMLYELTTGRMPYNVRGISLTDAARIIRCEEPLRPGALARELRGDVETVVAKAMEKEPARRYRDAGALAADLRRMLRDEPIVARPTSAVYRVVKFARRHRALVAGGAAVTLALVMGLVTTTWQAVRATHASEAALVNAERAELETYVASIAAATQALRIGDVVTARVRLDTAPQRWRSFEWWHLHSKLDQSTTTLSGPVTTGYDIAVCASGLRVAVVGSRATCVWDLLTRERVLTLARRLSATARVALDHAGERLALLGASSPEDVELIAVSLGTQRTVRMRAPVLDAAFAAGGELAVVDSEGRLSTIGLDGELTTRERPLVDSPALARFALDAARIALVTPTPTAELVVFEREAALESWRAALASTAIRALEFSSDGASLAIADQAGGVRLLDCGSGRELERFSPSDLDARTLVLAAGTRFVATVGPNDSIEVFERGRHARPIAHLAGHRMELDALTVVPTTGGLVSCSRDGVVKLWSLGAASLEGQPCQSAAFDAHGRLLVRDCAGDDLRVFDARAGREVMTLATDGREPREAFAPDGSLIALYGAPGRELVVLEIATAREVARLDTGDEEVACAAFRPGRSEIATLDRSAGGSARLWNLTDGRELARFEASSFYGQRLCFSADGTYLACAPESGGVLVWNADQGRVVHEFERGFAGFTAIAFDGETHALAAAGYDGVIRLFDIGGGATRHVRTNMREAFALTFVPGAGRIAAIDTAAGLRLFDIVSAREVAHLLDANSETPLALVASPDGSMLAACVALARGEVYGLRILDAGNPGQRLTRALSEELVAPAAVIAQLESEPNLSEELRAQALEHARTLTSDPERWNSEAWTVACFPGAPAADYERALVLARAAVSVEPERGYYLNTLGATLFRTGQLELARRTLERAVELNDAGLPVDFSLLALTHAALGDRAGALAALERARGFNWIGGTPGALLAEAERALAATPAAPSTSGQ